MEPYRLNTEHNETDLFKTFIKYNTQGKVLLETKGPKDYRDIISECLNPKVCDVRVTINWELFIKLLKEKEVPESVIKEYLDNLKLQEKTWIERDY